LLPGVDFLQAWHTLFGAWHGGHSPTRVWHALLIGSRVWYACFKALQGMARPLPSVARLYIFTAGRGTPQPWDGTHGLLPLGHGTPLLVLSRKWHVHALSLLHGLILTWLALESSCNAFLFEHASFAA